MLIQSQDPMTLACHSANGPAARICPDKSLLAYVMFRLDGTASCLFDGPETVVLWQTVALNFSFERQARCKQEKYPLKGAFLVLNQHYRKCC